MRSSSPVSPCAIECQLPWADDLPVECWLFFGVGPTLAPLRKGAKGPL